MGSVRTLGPSATCEVLPVSDLGEVLPMLYSLSGSTRCRQTVSDSEGSPALQSPHLCSLRSPVSWALGLPGPFFFTPWPPEPRSESVRSCL